MRRKVSLLLAVLLLAALFSACGGEQAENPGSSTPQTVSPAPEDSDAPDNTPEPSDEPTPSDAAPERWINVSQWNKAVKTAEGILVLDTHESRKAGPVIGPAFYDPDDPEDVTRCPPAFIELVRATVE